MVRLTRSLEHWLWEFHREKLALIKMGHTELLTEDMYNDYMSWLRTEDAKPYLS